MNPTRIVLRDFGSYAHEDIDLSSIKAAVLLGANGSGKSTLIEAIPWALYGAGSKGGKRSAGNYVRRGADSCAVALHFVQGGTPYIVQREYFVDRGRTALALFRADTESGEIEDVSAKGIVETQAMIESIAGMDYGAFTASVFALQGDSASLASDSLTDQERKEILSSILGLSVWDAVLDKARTRLRETQSRQASLSGSADVLAKQYAAAEGLQEQLGERLQRAEELEKRVGRLQADRDNVAAELAMAQAEADRLNAADLQQCVGALAAAMRGVELEIVKVRGELDRQLVALKNETAKVEASRQRDADKLAQLFQAEEGHDAQAHLEAITQLVEALTEEHHKREAVQQRVLVLERRAVAAKTARDRKRAGYEAQLARSVQDAALLEKVPCGQDMHAKCALLKNAVDAAGTLPRLQEAIAGVDAEVSPDEAALAEAAAELAECPEVMTDLTAAMAEQRECAARVAQQAQAAQLRSAVEHSERELERIATQMLSTQSNADNMLIQLMEKDQALAEQHEQALADMERVGSVVEKARALTEQLRVADADVAAMRAAHSSVVREVGQLQGALDDALAAGESLAELQARLDEVKAIGAALELVERAAGKRSGVPALIMENALPAIERLANEALSAMNDGRFEVRFETQLTTKSGTQQDVMRLYIYDGPEPRPYVTFSGAERFMVDLAMRMAVARFLAESSGSEVRMLVLDEGLSVLDGANRLEATQALLGAADRFDKLLVVTHIAELQDMFAQRIVVEKTATGSCARIV